MLFKTACTAERDFLADLISCGCVFLAEVFFLADVFFLAKRAKGKGREGWVWDI